MKDVFKEYLFNHGYLVSEGMPEDLGVAFATCCLMAGEFGVVVKFGAKFAKREMVEYVARMLGRDIPEPFYRGFPNSVASLTTDERLFDQLLHYHGVDKYSVMEEFVERKAFNESYEPKVFYILPEGEAVGKMEEYMNAMASSTRPLNDDQYKILKEFISEYNTGENRPCCDVRVRSKNTAIKLALDFREARWMSYCNISDVIKLVEELNYREYGQKNIKRLNLKNKDRKFIANVMDYMFINCRCDLEECYEKQALWCGLLHHIHYKPRIRTDARFCNAMRSGVNHSAMSTFEYELRHGSIRNAVNTLKNAKGAGAVMRNLQYLISRCRSEEDIDYVVSCIGGDNGIILLQLLQKYKTFVESDAPRTFKFTKHNMLVVHNETKDEVSRRKSAISSEDADKICKAVTPRLYQHYSGTLGKVFIDPAMKNIALPIQETASSSGYGVLPRGTRIPLHGELNKKLRAFTYWKKVNDIDLSAIAIGDDGECIEFSWRTMWSNDGRAIIHSGDETRGFYGGSEYFDIDMDTFKKQYPMMKYIVLCNNVFSSATFADCICTAGYMLRDEHDSGRVYEPKTVQTSFAINCKSRFAYLFAIDIEREELIWLNTGLDSNQNIAGNSSMEFLRAYFNITDVMNVERFFTMLSTTVVDNPDEADVIVSDEDIRPNDGQELIRGCDLERIIELMNK